MNTFRSNMQKARMHWWDTMFTSYTGIFMTMMFVLLSFNIVKVIMLKTGVMVMQLSAIDGVWMCVYASATTAAWGPIVLIIGMLAIFVLLWGFMLNLDKIGEWFESVFSAIGAWFRRVFNCQKPSDIVVAEVVE